MIKKQAKAGQILPNGFFFESVNFTKIRQVQSEKYRKIFAAEGFSEIVPPICDFQHAFQLSQNEAIQEPSFEFLSKRGESLALRSDITIQILRYVRHLRQSETKNKGQESPSQRRFYYLQPIFVDAQKDGWSRRKKNQIGVEIIGDDPCAQVGYLLDLARLILKGHNYRVVYGDARVLQTLLNRISSEHHDEFLVAFYHKDRHTLQELCEREKFSPSLQSFLLDLPLTIGFKENVMTRLRAGIAKIRKENDLGRPKKKLSGIVTNRPEILTASDLDAMEGYFREAEERENVILDFSLIRPFSYYNGPVFEAFFPDSAEPVLTGGVYHEPSLCQGAGFSIHFSLLIERSLQGAN